MIKIRLQPYPIRFSKIALHDTNPTTTTSLYQHLRNHAATVQLTTTNWGNKLSKLNLIATVENFEDEKSGHYHLS